MLAGRHRTGRNKTHCVSRTTGFMIFSASSTKYALLSCFAILGACEKSSDAIASTSARTPVHSTSAQTPRSDTEQQTNGPISAPRPIVDLLRAVAANVVVSSAYRDDPMQAMHIADGDLETAWNSRSQELLQSWFEVHLPAEVQVSAIEMTVGFTQQTQTADLFTGNQRIARVRILHEGAAPIEHSFDIDSRTLQSIPISGGGGSYRVEMVELRPGTHSNWAEVCVSELRVMGSAENATAERRFPHFYVGSVPEARPAAALAPEQQAQAFVAAQRTFAEAWSRLEHDRRRDENNTGEPGIDAAEERTFARARIQILNRLAGAIEANAPLEGDAIRALTTHGFAATDLQDVADELHRVLERLPAPTNCAWTRSYIGILLTRVADGVSFQRELNDMDDAMGEGASGPDLGNIEARMQDLQFDYRENPGATIHALQRVRMPDVARIRADWSTLTTLIARDASSCGW